MESGIIVEFIDRQRILCAVVLEIKKDRLRLLTENNREIRMSASRLLHRSDVRLDLSVGRDKLVDALKTASDRRNALIPEVDRSPLLTRSKSTLPASPGSRSPPLPRRAASFRPAA